MPKFVPRQRKHKVLRRTNGGKDATPALDSNALELLPASQREREERRRKLKEELRAQQPKMSGKKQKRLDKYIETKLKKEENLELIKRLAMTKVDTTLLRSSKMLGRVKESRREVLGRALRERQRGIDVDGDQVEVLFDTRVKVPLHVDQDQDEGEDGDEDEQSEENETLGSAVLIGTIKDETSKPVVDDSEPPEPLSDPPKLVIGSGLKRPLDVGEDGNPIIPIKGSKKLRTNATFSILSAPEWQGIISSEDEDSIDSKESTDELENSDAESGTSLTGDGSDTSEEVTSDEAADDDDDDDDEKAAARKQRTSAFKAWATQQINESLGFQPAAHATSSPSNDITHTSSNPITITHTPRAPDHDLPELPPELQIIKTTSDRIVHAVPITRTPEMETARLSLPIVAEEQKIMEAINGHPAVIIWGTTGSGKTTQIPQFLYEAGYGSKSSSTPGMIGITQPRRVAAVSMAKRVSEEMGDSRGLEKVAYKIRFEGTVKGTTAIKFMTDGVLLREASEDITLRKYSAIVIDEAHERTKDTDILIGMMSRIIKLRSDLAKEDSTMTPLKLIIMSATLRIEDFTQNRLLFKQAPVVVKAEGRQHPVKIHWARRTQRDYVEEVFKKICRAHRKLPPGGILVFLTGQAEIKDLQKRLAKTFPVTKESAVADGNFSVALSGSELPLETEDIELGGNTKANGRSNKVRDLDARDDADSESDSDAEFDVSSDVEDSTTSTPTVRGGPPTTSQIHLLPLYSLLPTALQILPFQAPPPNSRLIILSTNIAETSLTIPHIRYVIDTGRAKRRVYDPDSGIQSFEVGWISKASAMQRAGRAGRVGKGHCWRIYSSAVYERDFDEYGEIEMSNTPVEGVVLQLSGMNVPGLVNKFPFPTSPDRQRILQAQKLLTHLGALHPTTLSITPLGTLMSTLPLPPRHAKVLLVPSLHSTLSYTIALIAALSVPEIFLPSASLDLIAPTSTPTETAHESDSSSTNIITESHTEHNARLTRLRSYNAVHHRLSTLLPSSSTSSDALKLLAAVLLYSSQDSSSQSSFCTSNFLRSAALAETLLLRRQLHRLLLATHPTLGTFVPALPIPTPKQTRHLRQILASGWIDQIAIRADLAPSPPATGHRRPKRAIDVPYLPLFAATSTSSSIPQIVYLHPSSVLSKHPPANLPPYIIYSHLQRASGGPITANALDPTEDNATPTLPQKKTRMLPLLALAAADVLTAARGSNSLVEWGKPVKIDSEDEQGRWRTVWVVPCLRGEKGNVGWPLPAVKVKQRRKEGQWVNVVGDDGDESGGVKKDSGK